MIANEDVQLSNCPPPAAVVPQEVAVRAQEGTTTSSQTPPRLSRAPGGEILQLSIRLQVFFDVVIIHHVAGILQYYNIHHTTCHVFIIMLAGRGNSSGVLLGFSNMICISIAFFMKVVLITALGFDESRVNIGQLE